MLEYLDSTNISLLQTCKVLKTGKGREAWSAAGHGVAELNMSEQLKNSNNSVSHMSVRRKFSNLKYGILYIPLGKVDAS